MTMKPIDPEGSLVTSPPPGGDPAPIILPRSNRLASGRLRTPLLQSGFVLAVGIIIICVYSRQYFGGVFILALTYAVVTVGMAVQIGYSQQVAFSQAVFMGVGAYGVALLNTREHIPSVFAAIIVTIGGSILSLAVGSVVSKARGLALPVATIMFPLIAAGYVGGANYLGGAIGLPLTGNLWPWGSSNEITIGNGIIVVAVVALAVFFASRTLSSQVGLELFILGINEATAAAMGVVTPRRKLELFVTGSTLATLGGALYAGSQLFVPQTIVTASAQLSLLLMLFIGGRRSVVGAVIGAFAIEYFSGISNYVSIHILLIEGALVTIILLIEPEGLAGIGLRVRTQVLRGFQLLSQREVVAVAGPGIGAERGHLAGLSAVRARLAGSRGADEVAVVVDVDLGDAQASSVPVRATGSSAFGTGRGERWPQAQAGSELLVVDDLVMRFGGLQVLDHVNLSLPPTGIFGLCGPNGAGKSTLLNIIGGSLPPSSGRVTLSGQDVTYRPANEHFALGVSRTFQAVHLVPGRSVLENVAVACLSSNRHSLLRGVVDRGMPDAMDRAEAALEFLGLGELRDREVTSLTLEGQRMVELARAIAPEPRLLLLDEPASGLSEAQRDALKSTLRSVSSITSILLVEHDLHMVAEVAQKIFVLVTGRVLFEGDGQEFYASELVQSSLIGSSTRARRPQAGGRRARLARLANARAGGSGASGDAGGGQADGGDTEPTDVSNQ
jgi:branched-chain amino acid transport system permease protein